MNKFIYLFIYVFCATYFSVSLALDDSRIARGAWRRAQPSCSSEIGLASSGDAPVSALNRYLELGDRAAHWGGYDNAIKWYSKAEKILQREDPLYPCVVTWLAVVHTSNGDWADALSCYTEAQALFPEGSFEWCLVVHNSGYAYERLKFLEKARDYYVMSLNGQSPFLYAALNLLYLATQHDHLVSEDVQFTCAQQLAEMTPDQKKELSLIYAHYKRRFGVAMEKMRSLSADSKHR